MGIHRRQQYTKGTIERPVQRVVITNQVAHFFLLHIGTAAIWLPRTKKDGGAARHFKGGRQLVPAALRPVHRALTRPHPRATWLRRNPSSARFVTQLPTRRPIQRPARLRSPRRGSLEAAPLARAGSLVSQRRPG